MISVSFVTEDSLPARLAQTNHVFAVAKRLPLVLPHSFIGAIKGTDSQGIGIAIVPKASGETPLVVRIKIKGMKVFQTLPPPTRLIFVSRRLMRPFMPCWTLLAGRHSNILGAFIDIPVGDIGDLRIVHVDAGLVDGRAAVIDGDAAYAKVLAEGKLHITATDAGLDVFAVALDAKLIVIIVPKACRIAVIGRKFRFDDSRLACVRSRATVRVGRIPRVRRILIRHFIRARVLEVRADCPGAVGAARRGLEYHRRQ